MKRELFLELCENLIKTILSSKPQKLNSAISMHNQILEDVEKYLLEFGKKYY